MSDREKRERLLDIMRDARNSSLTSHNVMDHDLGLLADALLQNGVIVPPCKVGDMVYVISRYYTGNWQIYSCTVEYITKYKSNCFINAVFSKDINFGVNIVEFGKTVFLTREEAEKALAERKVKSG